MNLKIYFSGSVQHISRDYSFCIIIRSFTETHKCSWLTDGLSSIITENLFSTVVYICKLIYFLVYWVVYINIIMFYTCLTRTNAQSTGYRHQLLKIDFYCVVCLLICLSDYLISLYGKTHFLIIFFYCWKVFHKLFLMRYISFLF